MKSKGFTLVEIVVTAAVIGLIAGVTIPTYKYVVDTTNTNTCAKNRRTLGEAESLFALGEGRHSGAMQELVDAEYLKDVPECPAGYGYTWAEYEPGDPNYKSIPVCPLHNPADIVSTYGNLIRSTKYLNLFDSGALISKISDLAYIPDYDANSVLAVLSSGTEIQTDGLGGATVTFSDGTTKTIEDIFGSWQYLKSDFTWTDDNMSYSGDYMYVGYGYASEGDYKRDYLSYDFNYDSSTKSYSYDAISTYSSTYSSASLNTNYGYVSEGTYETNEPSRYSFTLDYQDDGSYKGRSSYSDNISSQYSYGYNRQGTQSQYTYAGDGGYDYSYTSDYSYDAATKEYKNSQSGSYSYNYEYDFGNDQTTSYSNSYTYTGEYAYNYNTRAYSSTYTYNYENGYSYTYSYSYNPSTGRYTYSYTLN